MLALIETVGQPFLWVMTPIIRDAEGWSDVVVWPNKDDNGVSDMENECDISTSYWYGQATINDRASYNKGILHLCDDFWELLMNLDDLRDNPTTALGRHGFTSDNLDEYHSRPGVFLHELCHDIGLRECELSLNNTLLQIEIILDRFVNPVPSSREG